MSNQFKILKEIYFITIFIIFFTTIGCENQHITDSKYDEIQDVVIDTSIINNARRIDASIVKSSNAIIKFEDKNRPTLRFASSEDFEDYTRAVEILAKKTGEPITIHESLKSYVKYAPYLPVADLHFIDEKGQIIINNELFVLNGDSFIRKNILSGKQDKLSLINETPAGKATSGVTENKACFYARYNGIPVDGLIFTLAENYKTWRGSFGRARTGVKFYAPGYTCNLTTTGTIEPNLSNFGNNGAKLTLFINYQDDKTCLGAEDSEVSTSHWDIEDTVQRCKNSGFIGTGVLEIDEMYVVSVDAER